MAIWARIKNLNFKQFFVLAQHFTLHPTYILPTYKATKKSVNICNRLFGKAHHKDNKTNAFRHALWNFYIAEFCFRGNNSVKDSLAWAKKITDLHEELSPNPKLPKAMDLHNNEVGRYLFQQKIASEEIIETLKQMMEEAKKIKQSDEISAYKNQLVFIEPLN